MKLLIWIWLLPQHLVALVLRMFVKVYTKEKYKGAIIYKCNLKSGSISLGKYIFLCDANWHKGCICLKRKIQEVLEDE